MQARPPPAQCALCLADAHHPTSRLRARAPHDMLRTPARPYDVFWSLVGRRQDAHARGRRLGVCWRSVLATLGASIFLARPLLKQLTDLKETLAAVRHVAQASLKGNTRSRARAQIWANSAQIWPIPCQPTWSKSDQHRPKFGPFSVQMWPMSAECPPKLVEVVRTSAEIGSNLVVSGQNV